MKNTRNHCDGVEVFFHKEGQNLVLFQPTTYIRKAKAPAHFSM